MIRFQDLCPRYIIRSRSKTKKLSFNFLLPCFQQDAIETNPEDTSYPEEELIDFETLLDDDTFMSLTFQ